jgi:ribosomal protein L37AE/L43A
MIFRVDSDQELKPCPFCGGPATIKSRYRTIISCKKCDFELAKWDKSLAVGTWNTRA